MGDPLELYEEAYELKKKGEYQKALEKVDECLKVNKKEEGIWLLQAEIYSNLGQPEKVENSYNECKNKENADTDSYRIFFLLGRCYFNLEKFEKAKEVFDRMTQDDIPEKYKKKRDYLKYLSEFRINDDLKTAKANLATFKNNYGDDNVEYLTIQYEVFLRSFEYEKAFECSKKLIELDPDNENGFFDKLYCLLGQGEYNEIVSSVEKHLNEKDLLRRNVAQGKFYLGVAKRNLSLNERDDAKKKELVDEFLNCMKEYQENGVFVDNIEYFNEMSLYYNSIGNKKERDNYINKAIGKNPRCIPSLILKLNYLRQDNADDKAFEKELNKSNILEQVKKYENDLQAYSKKVKNTNPGNSIPSVPESTVSLATFSIKKKTTGKAIVRSYNKDISKDIKKKLKECVKSMESSITDNDIYIRKGKYNEEKVEIEYSYAIGDSLRDYIKKGKLTKEIKVDLILKILSGLKELRQKKLYHMNLEPSNIIVHGEGNNLKIYLIEYGLYDALSKIPNHNLEFLPYCPPEAFIEPQIKNKIAFDLFSFGVVAYFIIYEKELFNDKTKEETKDTYETGNPEITHYFKTEEGNKSKEIKDTLELLGSNRCDYLSNFVSYDVNDRTASDEVINKFLSNKQ